jgi:hypothetical protein
VLQVLSQALFGKDTSGEDTAVDVSETPPAPQGFELPMHTVRIYFTFRST